MVMLEKTLESPLDSKEIKPINPKWNQPWIFSGMMDAEAEAPNLWAPDMKSWLTGKDPDAGKEWRWEEKGMTEDEMVGWHHWLNWYEFEQTLEDGEGQESLLCCRSWSCKETWLSDWKTTNLWEQGTSAHPETLHRVACVCGLALLAGCCGAPWGLLLHSKQPQSSVQFSCSVESDCLRPHGLQHARLPCPSPTPRACSNSCPSSRWCHPIISTTLDGFKNSFISLQFCMSEVLAQHGWVLCTWVPQG